MADPQVVYAREGHPVGIVVDETARTMVPVVPMPESATMGAPAAAIAEQVAQAERDAADARAAAAEADAETNRARIVELEAEADDRRKAAAQAETDRDTAAARIAELERAQAADPGPVPPYNPGTPG